MVAPMPDQKIEKPLARSPMIVPIIALPKLMSPNAWLRIALSLSIVVFHFFSAP